MPRGARLDGPGVLHHVRARGIERGRIFTDDRDRENFLKRLGEACADGAAFVYAWALMTNHFHLAIRTGAKPLSTTMRKLLTGYAISYNRRHKRTGHLFQNRYGSTVVDEETYFLALLRYIHLNPVRAGIVQSLFGLEKYPWTGHSVLFGQWQRDWQDTDEVLRRFGQKTGEARGALVDFMRSHDAKADERTFKGGGGGLIRSIGGLLELSEHRKGPKWLYDERVLGDGKFVEHVLTEYAPSSVATLSLSEGERLQRLESVLDLVSRLSGVTRAELTGGSRRREVARIRNVVCYLGTRHVGFSAARLGELLAVARGSAARCAQRGEEIWRELGWEVDDILGKGE